MSVEGYNSDIARHVYNFSRQIVNSMVKSGKIAAENADKEWAKRVVEGLLKAGLKVPEKILKMIK